MVQLTSKILRSLPQPIELGNSGEEIIQAYGVVPLAVFKQNRGNGYFVSQEEFDRLERLCRPEHRQEALLTAMTNMGLIPKGSVLVGCKLTAKVRSLAAFPSDSNETLFKLNGIPVAAVRQWGETQQLYMMEEDLAELRRKIQHKPFKWAFHWDPEVRVQSPRCRAPTKEPAPKVETDEAPAPKADPPKPEEAPAPVSPIAPRFFAAIATLQEGQDRMERRVQRIEELVEILASELGCQVG